MWSTYSNPSGEKGGYHYSQHRQSGGQGTWPIAPKEEYKPRGPVNGSSMESDTHGNRRGTVLIEDHNHGADMSEKDDHSGVFKTNQDALRASASSAPPQLHDVREAFSVDTSYQHGVPTSEAAPFYPRGHGVADSLTESFSSMSLAGSGFGIEDYAYPQGIQRPPSQPQMGEGSIYTPTPPPPPPPTGATNGARQPPTFNTSSAGTNVNGSASNVNSNSSMSQAKMAEVYRAAYAAAMMTHQNQPADTPNSTQALQQQAAVAAYQQALAFPQPLHATHRRAGGRDANGAEGIQPMRRPWSSAGSSVREDSAGRMSTLADAEGKVFELAKDPQGSRFLQARLEDEGRWSEGRQIVENEVVEAAGDLMTHALGNYLVQKLVSLCSPALVTSLLRSLAKESSDEGHLAGREKGKEEMTRVAISAHGTRALQRLVTASSTDEQRAIIASAMAPSIDELIRDSNGNHVVQRAIETLTTPHSQFIVDAVDESCLELARHRSGCCVLQRCLQHSPPDARRHMSGKIAAESLLLSQDPYGNYVVQFLLRQRETDTVTDILRRLHGSFPTLSAQKFSSNVVERCLEEAEGSLQSWREEVVDELIEWPFLGSLLVDPYSNYVFQSALQVSSSALHARLLVALKPHLAALRTSPFGKRILARTPFQ